MIQYNTIQYKYNMTQLWFVERSGHQQAVNVDRSHEHVKQAAVKNG